MLTIQQRLQLAEANTGGSVVRINPDVLSEAQDKTENPATFGIKNTDAIPKELIDTLRNHPDFLWLTVDKMSALGRSVDTDLTNPITYRYMTGSSSGGCINILKGMTDLAFGTDGGGSVLAPALSTNLYSFLGSGAGIVSTEQGVSTDDLPFSIGIGVIAKDFSLLKKAGELLLGTSIPSSQQEVQLIVPAPGSLMLPDGTDAREMLDPILAKLSSRYQVTEFFFSAPYDRVSMVKDLERIFSNDANLLLTFEGPVDVFAYDETIPRSFRGKAAKTLTIPHSKASVKAANIHGCSAFTIPSQRLASGFVITCAPGITDTLHGFALAEQIASASSLPSVFQRYFIHREKYTEPSTYI